MAAIEDLSQLTFTNEADKAAGSGVTGVTNGGTSNTLAGNDTIDGTGSTNSGIFNDGTLSTGDGEDRIVGTGGFTGIYNVGTIDTAADNDTIESTGVDFGICNDYTGTLNTGDGNDTITGSGSNVGIYNSGKFQSGGGDDTITTNIIGDPNHPFPTPSAIINDPGATFDAGDGNDSINATGGYRGIYNNGGTFDTGAGNDSITATGTDSIGIENSGTLNTGDGNDTITGSGSIGIYNFNGWFKSYGIKGIIDTGDGNDIVDALTGGFRGDGITSLGKGADVLKGFGEGRFDGGWGSDTLLLPAGTSYSISASANDEGYYTVTNGTTDMFVNNFQLIGSASRPGDAVSFSDVIGSVLFL